jgi:hypothetical protein
MSGAMYTPTKSGFEDEIGGATISPKIGHSCCGCCCDTRRAVIIVNAVMTCFTLLSAVLMVAGVEILEAAAADADDDAVAEVGKELQSFPVGIMVVLMLIQAAFYVLGVWGAINYKKYFVVAALCAYVLSFVINLLQLGFFGMVLAVLFAYPHVFFIKELDANIMTPENYPNEVQSCCCV